MTDVEFWFQFLMTVFECRRIIECRFLPFCVNLFKFRNLRFLWTEIDYVSSFLSAIGASSRLLCLDGVRFLNSCSGLLILFLSLTHVVCRSFFDCYVSLEASVLRVMLRIEFHRLFQQVDLKNCRSC